MLNLSIRNTIIHFHISNLIKKINKGQKKFQNNNVIFFNPSWSNKLYFKESDE
jgi:hypothetical protein